MGGLWVLTQTVFWISCILPVSEFSLIASSSLSWEFALHLLINIKLVWISIASHFRQDLLAVSTLWCDAG